jgi:type II secretory pathway predicted ATPase ExeA
MYEHYFGLSEKPFSLTPDPKYLYRAQSHANAFELLQYAIARREGLVVITGDIGTGKTTVCRALLDEIDRTTFSALVLNPFLSEEDLLKRILQDFGVVSREQIKAGRLKGASKQELIETLYDFLLGLVPLKRNAVVIIDEAQHLPLPVLEQIRMLSNLETDTDKLLQIVLVGQLNLETLLRSPELRQLDQRVSIRHRLAPLDRDTVGAYVAHRLTIAGSSGAVTFAPEALDALHRLTAGIPRVINLVCDRALLAAFSVRANRVTGEMVAQAAASLELPPATAGFGRRKASLASAGAVALAASALAVGSSTILYQRFFAPTVEAATPAAIRGESPVLPGTGQRLLPPTASRTILVGSYSMAAVNASANVRAMTEWLEMSGYEVYYADVDLGPRGRWQHVLAGAYSDAIEAEREARRLNAVVPGAAARVVDTAAVRAAEQRR